MTIDCSRGNFGPFSQTITRRSGSGYGNDLSNTEFTTEKMAVVAPIANASVTTAIDVKPGFFQRTRMPYRTSCQNDLTMVMPIASRHSSLICSNPPKARIALVWASSRLMP